MRLPLMADFVAGTRVGYVNLTNCAVDHKGTWNCPPASPRLSFREQLGRWHKFDRKSLSRGFGVPVERGWRAVTCVQAMTQKELNDLYTLSADNEKDESMIFRRTVFDHEDWTRHRSSKRHSRHILSLASSRVIRSLGYPVLRLTCIATVVAAFNEAVLADFFPEWVPLLHVPSLPFQLTAPALALLLVFRTNASYGRFDEARKAWGSTVNRTRDISRQSLTWIRLPADSDKLNRLLRYVVAFPFCLKDHLTRGGNLTEDLSGLLDQNELEVLLRHPQRPNYILQTISEIFYNCNLSDMERALLDRNVTQFHDNLGCCERILKTPIPLSYTRLTSRFLVIWHTALPFALWDECSWVVIPATFCSAGALFCIEEVGVLIEEPFTLLALRSICTSIQKNVEGLKQAHVDNLILSQQVNRMESLRISTVNGLSKQGEDHVIKEAGREL